MKYWGWPTAGAHICFAGNPGYAVSGDRDAWQWTGQYLNFGRDIDRSGCQSVDLSGCKCMAITGCFKQCGEEKDMYAIHWNAQ